jgi:hypothetical protein
LTSNNNPIYGIPCDTWGGHPAAHQEEARRVYGLVPPFTWIALACGIRSCLVREHMVVHQPIRLGYKLGICIYCGFEASTKDHLVPEPWSGGAQRHSVVTVPACRECNNLINDSYSFNITERRGLAHQRIQRKHGKWLNCKNFTDDELAEMGRNLRSKVDEGMQMRAITEARLAWPYDPFYDLTAANEAGIENPYLIGMLTDPQQEAA